MLVRILSEWKGSAPCGAIANVDDADAVGRIAQGFAERIAAPAPETAVESTPVRIESPASEVAIPSTPERAIQPKAKSRR